MDQIQNLIKKYIDSKKKQTSIYMEMEKARENSALSKDLLHEKYHELKDRVSESCLELVGLISKLSNSEKIDLVTSEQKTYDNPTDPWNLDDLYAREALFKYIVDPSNEVIFAHEKHRERMIAEFKKYDG